jgi:hypothetical protein
METAEFLRNIRAARQEWDGLVAQALTQEEQSGGAYEETGSSSEAWSLKDLIAHNIWYEQEIVRLLRTHSLSFEPSDELWAMRNDERNKALYEMYHHLPLDAVLAEEKQAYKDLFIELLRINDADLNDPTRFEGMPADWMPWKVLAENSYEHYSDHLADLRKLLGIPQKSE